MKTTQRFCLVCQAQFDVGQQQENCPQCGKTWQDWTYAPTIDSEFPPDASGQDAADEGPDELLDTEFDKYHIHEFLGQGGMARVYRAADLALQRSCAIKVLRETKRHGDQAADSFLAEARAAAALMHPHVVAIHTIGEYQGRPFIEMEYIDGPSLAEHLRAVGRLAPLPATRFMMQICAALESAHELGMVHRDIKPANVMVARATEAKLADFGLAKQITSSQPTPSMLSGTPSFMAPELFKGAPASKASDIYAVGVTYFSLLTGHLPVSAKSVNELINFHDQAEQIDLDALAPDLPGRVSDVIRRSLAPRSEERFEDAATLGLALREVFGSLRSLAELLAEALENQPVQINPHEGRFEILVRLAQGRSQRVTVELMPQAGGMELVRIYSVCGLAVADQYAHALEMNAVIHHGALAIEQIGGQPYFVAVDAYPRATCEPLELRESVMTIAANADRLEALLHDDDVF